MVCEFKARIYIWFRALSLLFCYKVLLCWSQVHVCWIRWMGLYLSHDLDFYVKWPWEGAKLLQSSCTGCPSRCLSPWNDRWLQDLLKEFIIFFILLVHESCKANQLIRQEPVNSSMMNKSRPTKRPVIEKSKRDKGSSPKRMSSNKGNQSFHILPPFPCRAKNVAAI